MLCNKISKILRKGFLQLLDGRMNKIIKQVFFLWTLHHKLSFTLCHEILLTPVPEIWATLLYILYISECDSLIKILTQLLHVLSYDMYSQVYQKTLPNCFFYKIIHFRWCRKFAFLPSYHNLYGSTMSPFFFLNSKIKPHSIILVSKN